MANVVIDDTHLSDIAAAIREKNGLTDTYKPSEMAAAIQAITTSSGDPDTPASTIDFDDYIGRNLSGEVEFACTKVGSYGLAGCSKVTKFTVGGEASGSCAFKACSKLQELVLPDTTVIGSSSCANLSQLTTVDIPQVTEISSQAFMDCTALTTVNAPQATKINDEAFYGCTALTDVTLGDVTTIGEDAFRDCTALTKIDLGSTDQVHHHYAGDFGACLYGGIFQGCEALTAIIIRDKIPYCIRQYPCPFPEQFRADYEGLLEPGYIYVPAAMISEYQNYQANVYGVYPYYDQFTMMKYRAIEDYPEICG